MERRFYTDEFEDLLKQKADQYKLYPSERVWKEIYKSIHPRRKWYWIGFAILLSGVGYYSVNELTAPVSPDLITKNPSPQDAPTTNQPVPHPSEIVPFKAPARPARRDELADAYKIEPSAQPDEVFQRGSTSARVVSMLDYPREENNGTAADVSDGLNTVLDIESIAGDDFIESLLSKIDPAPKQEPKQLSAPSWTNRSEQQQEERLSPYNWLHEFAAYELAVPKTKRTSWQLFFSPTMNYRQLSGSQTTFLGTDVKNIPLALRLGGEMEGLVNHKPALGFELGSAVFYALNKSFSVKLGMQFNYSRYGIQAYNGPGEIATIALTNTANSFVRDSIQRFTQVRNLGGVSQRELENQYFQLSAPIGMEWRIIGNGRLQFNVAGSLQPTYLLNRNTYLITTDYQNYTKEPSLVRRWNVNSSVEAYLSYKTGGVRWQLGPQFRYQLLSSYVDEYPIKEYLMEYGMKIGVTKTIR